ncbi:MAG: hypothetical protein K9G58_00110 [Bacteroidales bacterium]|nr:hypothetical protein [Bacteroidales bacterium]MCF8396541.1 hypothetical protein [Bacteroidales bacterium]
MKKTLTIIIIILFTGACENEEIPDAQSVISDLSFEYLWSSDTVARYRFLNESSGADSYRWEFGDNLASDKSNPEHEYFQDGHYKVRLHAYKGNNEDISDTILKLEFKKLPPVADFEFYQTHVDTAVQVSFINRSYHVHTCNWRFDDGHGSSQINPVHYYKQNGDYQVRLKIHNAIWEVDSIIRTVSIIMK